ncbi:hypothetical protein VU12_03405 [Desulfobulbus sp. US4]|nr:hypothetical protein [Desulfobulbus sp. US4]
MKRQRKRFFALVGLFMLAPSQTQAAEIFVDAGGTCTLAEAITSANTDTATSDCPAGSGHDTIILETDVILDDARPSIITSVTIEGQGHTIDGNGGDGYVLKISRGILEEDGCIGGDLTLNNATITGGKHRFVDLASPGNGGGITNACFGTVTLNNTTVSGNSADGYGGGIFNAPRATLTLNNCTVSGNTALSNDGGGIYSDNGAATLNNSTISGNTAAGDGGGICGVTIKGPPPSIHNNEILLNSSIVSGNTASLGNELYLGLSDISVDNYNLFAHSDESDADAFYGFTPGSSDVNATSDGTSGIHIPTALSAIIDPLADNGGSTLTHALVPGSPAIDLDPNNVECSTGLATDQRGEPRPVGAGCDAGSYEVNMVSSNGNAFLPTLYFLLLRN